MTLISKATLVLLAIAMTSGIAHAEPTGPKTTLVAARPYVNSNTVYIYPVDPGPCNVSIYTLDLSTPAGKAAYAAALASITTGQPVALEAVSCTGIYSKIQSIYLYPQ